MKIGSYVTRSIWEPWDGEAKNGIVFKRVTDWMDGQQLCDVLWDDDTFERVLEIGLKEVAYEDESRKTSKV